MTAIKLSAQNKNIAISLGYVRVAFSRIALVRNAQKN